MQFTQEYHASVTCTTAMFVANARCISVFLFGMNVKTLQISCLCQLATPLN